MTPAFALTAALAVATTVEHSPTTLDLDPRLVGHLAAWEVTHRSMTSLSGTFEMTQTDHLRRTVKTFEGNGMLMKPNSIRWRAHEKGRAAGTAIEFTCDGKTQYVRDEELKANGSWIPLPEWFGRVRSPLLRVLLGPVTAKGLADDFDLRLVKEETHYVYISITPRRPGVVACDSLLLVLYGPATGPLAYQPAVVRIQTHSMTSLLTFTKNLSVNHPTVCPDSFRVEPSFDLYRSAIQRPERLPQPRAGD